MSARMQLQINRLEAEIDVLGTVCKRLVAKMRIIEKNQKSPPQVDIADDTPRPQTLKALGLGKDPE